MHMHFAHLQDMLREDLLQEGVVEVQDLRRHTVDTWAWLSPQRTAGGSSARAASAAAAHLAYVHTRLRPNMRSDALASDVSLYTLHRPWRFTA